MNTNHKKISATKVIIEAIKRIYEHDTPYEIERRLNHELMVVKGTEYEYAASQRVADLMAIVHKMDSCTSDCFKDIEHHSVGRCACNDELLSILILDNDTVHA